MEREQALKFLTEDCLFATPLTLAITTEIWESSKAIVESLPAADPLQIHPLPLSAADLKAARKFRNLHPNAQHIADFVRLNPMDLVVHQLWISTAIAERYRDNVTPDKWLQTALLDPLSNSRLNATREGDTITFDLPHAEFFLDGPTGPQQQMRIAEADGFITVSFHANRALLVRGYHRTFACAQYIREAVNAPRGVLFGLSNQLATIGSEADDIRRTMESPRPPRVADWFDDRLFLPVALRRRRYRIRIQCELSEIADEEPDAETTNAPGPSTAAPNFAFDHRSAHHLCEDAARLLQAGRIDEAAALYERAIFLRPDHAESHGYLGIAFARQGRLDDAVTHYERALALKPDNTDVLYNLALALMRQARFDDAGARLRQVLTIQPDHAEAHNDLASTFKYQGKFDDALAHYARAIAIRPDYAEAHFNRAEIKNFQRGDAELAALEALARQRRFARGQSAIYPFRPGQSPRRQWGLPTGL